MKEGNIKKYRIYTLENTKDGNIFYVGRTSIPLKLRLAAHTSFKKGRYFKGKFYDFVIKNKECIKIDEIDTCTEKDKNIIEYYWIYQFREWGFNLMNKNPPIKYKEKNYWPPRPKQERFIKTSFTPYEKFIIDGKKERRHYLVLAQKLGCSEEYVRLVLSQNQIPNWMFKEISSYFLEN